MYYPAFWWAEHVCDLHPIHAGAVDSPDGALVLAGPSGVGKSTLTVALSAVPGGRIMSDTFLLHQGPDLVAVPEPLLLDGWSRAWLGDAADALLGMPKHRYALGRSGYVVPSSGISNRSRAAVVVLPRRAPERFVRKITGAEAIWRIDAYDDIVNDLRRYRALAAVLELMEPGGLSQARLSSLEKLAASTPCYEVGLTPDISRSEAVNMLWGLCHGSNGEQTRRRVPGQS